jgi:hypothetical protein
MEFVVVWRGEITAEIYPFSFDKPCEWECEFLSLSINVLVFPAEIT